MNLLLLPGSRKSSRAWIVEVEGAIAPFFGKTHIQNYKHWETKETEIDLRQEIRRMSNELADFDPHCIFAKSAGTILACRATAEGKLKPKSCLFVGFPLTMIIDQSLPVDRWLLATNFPVTILQNENDPCGSYEEVIAFFQSVGRQHVALHSLPGNTHDYEDFESLREFASQLLRS